MADDDRTADELMADPAVRAGLARLGQQPPRKQRCPRCWVGMVNPASRHGFCQPCEDEYEEIQKASRRRSYRRRKHRERAQSGGGTDRDRLGQAEREIEIVAEDGSPFLRLDEACQVLRIGRSTLFRWIDAGHIKRIKLGGRSYITSDEILRAIEEAERRPELDQEEDDNG